MPTAVGAAAVDQRAWVKAPPTPPKHHLIDVDVFGGPQRLGLAIIRSGGWYAAAGAVLQISYNVANMLIPLALGRAVADGIGPVVAGTRWGAALGDFLTWITVIASLYLVTNLTHRFGGRLGWYAMRRAQFELSDRVMERILDRRGLTGPARLPGSLLALASLDARRACMAMYVAIYPIGLLVAVVVAAGALFIIHPVLGCGVAIGALLPGLLRCCWPHCASWWARRSGSGRWRWHLPSASWPCCVRRDARTDKGWPPRHREPARRCGSRRSTWPSPAWISPWIPVSSW